MDSNTWTLGPRHILVAVKEFAGEMRVHIRHHFNPDPVNTPQNLMPTKKGVALMLSEWEDLKTYVSRVDQHIKNDSDNSWKLGERNIMVTVNKFSGERRVHIRQYFHPDSSNDLMPTKKGVALNLAEWEMLKQHVIAVDDAITEMQQPVYYNPANCYY